MSAVNIEHMTDIARGHGLTIHSADIEIETLLPPPGLLLEMQSECGAHVYVVAHLFGAVSPISDAAELRNRGGFVVEDAAQSFAGNYHNGDPDADVTMFSFGPIKRATALGGAVGIFRDPDLAERVEKRISGYAPRSEAWFRRRAAKYAMLKLLATPPLLGLLVGLIEASGRNVDATIGSLARGFAQLSHIRRRMPRRMLVLLARRISGASLPEEHQHLCRTFLSLLPSESSILGSKAVRHAHWVMPIVSERPDVVIARLRAAGFDATRGSTSLRVIDSDKNTQAAWIINRVVYIPHPLALSGRKRCEMLQTIWRVFRDAPA